MSLIHGDCLNVLKSLPAESIDACVTDPPYGIGFMGREWDTFKPGTGKTRRLMHPRERVAAKIVSDNPNIHGRHRSPALSPIRRVLGVMELVFQCWPIGRNL